MKVLKLILLLLTANNLFALNNHDTLNHTIRNKYFELQQDIQTLISAPDFSNAFIGISVQSLNTGEYLYKYNADKNFIPASNLKLLTTATALNYLGSDFKYSTKIYLDGELHQNGEFEGNIIIRASGDPTLSKFFHDEPLNIIDHWAKILDSLGIRSIQGNLIGDDRYFDDRYYGTGWAWDDMLFPFSAQVNALSFNDNKLDFFVFQGDSTGETTDISIYPENSYIRIINNVKTGSENDLTDISVIREFGTNLLELKGVIAYDSTNKNFEKISATIDNPTLFFLNIFREKLESNQIRFRGALLDIDDINFKPDYRQLDPVIEYVSPSLEEIINIINKSSHNLAAEMLLKTIGKESTGIGGFEEGIEQVNKFLADNGINTSAIEIYDGSGLSRLNLISPNYIVTLLSVMHRSKYKYIYKYSLARPGEFGTLERRLRNTLAEKNVAAKTGSMNNVSTISGYVTTRDNEELAFSIMIQSYTVPRSMTHNLQDLILMRLSSFSRN